MNELDSPLRPAGLAKHLYTIELSDMYMGTEDGRTYLDRTQPWMVDE